MFLRTPIILWECSLHCDLFPNTNELNVIGTLILEASNFTKLNYYVKFEKQARKPLAAFMDTYVI